MHDLQITQILVHYGAILRHYQDPGGLLNVYSQFGGGWDQNF
jgi:hypothetical protein